VKEKERARNQPNELVPPLALFSVAEDGMQQQIRQFKGPWIQPIENVV
jgi:hypothetical protein